LFVLFVSFVVVFDRLFSRQAGIESFAAEPWIPAFAGMTALGRRFVDREKSVGRLA